MKYVPNILSCFRIVGSAVLLFLEPLSIPFFIIYIICGATDILDGYIARRTKNTSKVGAALDSVADMIFIGIMLFLFLPIISVQMWVNIWILGIAVIRILSWTVGYLKYRTFASLHTYGNKITGLLLFFFPFMYQFFGVTKAEYAILIIAASSGIEEMAIQITSSTLNINVKSIFLNEKKTR